jgi:putative transposase
MLSYRFRIYPSKTVQQTLSEHLELCRWLYNRLLEKLNHARTEGRQITQLETQALIVRFKEERPELEGVYSKVLQMVNYQLWSNLRALAGLRRNRRRVGRLRYKGGWFKTLNFNQSGFRLEGKKLLLSKVGEIPIRLHREIRGWVKGVVVKREQSGRWYAIFQVEDEPEPLPRTNEAVGIDVGIKHFLTDSKGRQIENPCFYEKSLKRIRIKQRQLSRKQKGSKNRERAKIKLAKAHEHLVDQRGDFLHKLSKFYVNNYDVIAVENLNIAGMARNHNLAQHIVDASWGKFLRLLSYKAERAGRTVVKVNPRRTSKECKHGELDRDYNAALNIIERGLVGLGRPELTPVEIEPLRRIPASSVVEAGSSAF